MALTSRYKVEIIGPSRSGDIWFPMKDIDIPIHNKDIEKINLNINDLII